MSKRRGKRVVVGYVVSHTGKRGGPWEAKDGPFGTATSRIADANRLTPEFVMTCGHHFYTLGLIRKHHPHARALPLVRYEVDAEEERLRDAVVEAADRWESEATPLYLVPSAAKELESAVRALRAHRILTLKTTCAYPCSVVGDALRGPCKSSFPSMASGRFA